MWGHVYAKRRPYLRVLLVLFVSFMCAFSLISCSGKSQEQSAGIPAVPQGETVKIGVCMPSTGSWTELSGMQSLGIRTASGFLKEKMGRKIELVFRDAGDSPQAFIGSVQRLLMDDQVSGIISCAAADEVAAVENVLRQKPVPFIITSPCRTDWKMKEMQHGLRIGTSLEDQAYACARFLSDELKARRIGLVVDVEDPAVVRAASLISSELIKTRSRIVGIAYMKKGEDPASSIAHLLGEKPDAIYVPYSGAHVMAVITRLRTHDTNRPLLLSFFQTEETLLEGGGKAFEGVYIQTDFIAESVRSSRGMEFIEFYRRHAGHRHEPGSNIAMGADAYFLMLDMIAGSQKTTLTDAFKEAASWKGSLLHITGVTPHGALHQEVLFGRIEKRFWGGATVKHVASVKLNRSDPVADIGTQ
ncbi:MAG: ABC transporter substrate-binding protein [Desulfobacterota bacterium]|nr:ABC transporter substrate-binding protein [Thermodesulfobacteriota bacterium]